MKTIQILFLLFFINTNVNAQHRGLFILDENGGTTLASNEKRIALVIGNENYRNGWLPLNNAVNDANTMSEALLNCGFEVTTITDATHSQFLDAIRSFKAKIQGTNTVALFYYTGHGLKENIENYLIPVDDTSKCLNEIAYNCMKISSIQEQLSEDGAAINIIIVDACRDILLPFTCSGSNRRGSNSVFTEFKAKGSYIAFSTTPGQTVEDSNKGSNSLYTTVLSKAIQQEGLKIEDVFKEVHRELYKIGQETWVSNGYSGDFYFKYEVKGEIKDSDNDGIIDSKDQCPY